MAIDTAKKRFSMMGSIIRVPLIVPSGAVDQADRQTFLRRYGGILWDVLAVVVTPSWRVFKVKSEERVFKPKWQDRTFKVPSENRTFKIK